MSIKHPVVVVTGSSGAGTSTVKKALESIFHRHRIRPASIEGDSLHRYDREEMQEQMLRKSSFSSQRILSWLWLFSKLVRKGLYMAAVETEVSACAQVWRKSYQGNGLWSS